MRVQSLTPIEMSTKSSLTPPVPPVGFSLESQVDELPDALSVLHRILLR
jgi:hypothetical protein